METLAGLLLLSLIWLLTVMTPGPNFLVTSQTAAGRSRSEAMWIALGVSVAGGVWAAASMAGLGLLMTEAGGLARALKWVGAAYLIFLGIKTLLGAGQPLPNPASIAGQGAATAGRAVRRGLLTSFANPKTAAFFASLFVLVLPPAPPLLLQLGIVGLVIGISLLWYGFVACLFSLVPVRAWYARCRRWVERAVGALLIGLGGRLALER